MCKLMEDRLNEREYNRNIQIVVDMLTINIHMMRLPIYPSYLFPMLKRFQNSSKLLRCSNLSGITFLNPNAALSVFGFFLLILENV